MTASNYCRAFAEPVSPPAGSSRWDMLQGSTIGFGITRLQEALRKGLKALRSLQLQAVLGAELAHHPGYAPGSEKPQDANNHRNGSTGKTILTDDGPYAFGQLTLNWHS